MSGAEDHCGRVLDGKWHLRRIVGSGGMGAVYEGLHVGIGKRVAIKVIAAEATKSGVTAARFLQEARAASAVESDHIVEVYDVGEDAACGLYMVMEFLVGEDLAARLRRDGRLDARVVVNMAFKLAGALRRAHAAGIVHRDIKPANVFLDEKDDGTVSPKLLDFGLSMILEKGAGKGDASASITGGSATVGTPHYMSPEQAQGFPVDRRTDVWSFGAVLYEALAGRPPWKPALTYERTIIDIVTKKAPPLETVAPWVPPAVAEVVHFALQHDPAARIQDFAAFAAMLRGALPDAFLPGVERRLLGHAPGGPAPDLTLPRLADYDDGMDEADLTAVDRFAVADIATGRHAAVGHTEAVVGAEWDEGEDEGATDVAPSPLLIAGDDWTSEHEATDVAPSPLGRPAPPRKR